MRSITVSVLQLRARTSKEESSKAVLSLASMARGDIIVLPEYAMVDPTGIAPQDLYSASEPIEGGWVSTLRRIAREKGSCIVGTLFERTDKPPLVYNTVVLIDERGDIAGVYRKTHLFDALGYRESEKMLPGEELFSPVDLCGARVGVAVCFELRYPEVFRLQALRGAEVFIVPSAWYRGPAKEETYKFLAQARAHENVSYLVGAVLAGERFTGRSIVVDPYGLVRAQAGFGEELLEYKLDPELLERARRDLPLLSLRRDDLYVLGEKRVGGYSSTGTIS